MYNIQVRDKQQRQEECVQKKQLKEEQWLRRYNSDIKPNLLSHYDARINAFIRRIQETPIILKTQPKTQPVHHQKLPSFRYKDPMDFKSIFTSLERLQLTANEKLMHNKFGDSTLAHKSILSQSIYKPISSYQFRVRQKYKEIKNKQSQKQVEYQKFTQEKKRKKKESQVKDREKMQKTNASDESAEGIRDRAQSKGGQMGKYVDDLINKSDIGSVYDDNQSSRHSFIDNLEKEAREYEKLQEVVEKKMHFKKLQDLSQCISDKKTQGSLRKLLIRCGVNRRKNKEQENEQTEVDLLTQALEK